VRKKLFLLDMDGTLYLGERLLPGAAELLAYIRSCGGTYLYLTNNSSRGADAYVEKMRRLGIAAEERDFLTSVDALLFALQKRPRPEALYYVCGTASMKAQLRRAGLRLAEEPSAEVTAVLCGFDTELTFRKLEDACRLLTRGADFWATNPDWVCPTEFGYVPDCGSVCEMLRRATGRTPEVAGKPGRLMVDLARQRCSCTPEQTLVIGDRLYTDIACAAAAGVDSALVLCGESTEETLRASPVRPTAVYAGPAALLAALRADREGAPSWTER
jgi:HAD superfamily hydrolase (TIGR01450 family)